MACTNHGCGWSGYRWGRGPDWTTTGGIRPVTEIARSVAVAVDDVTGDRADQVLVDAALTDQAARGAIGLVAAVVDWLEANQRSATVRVLPRRPVL